MKQNILYNLTEEKFMRVASDKRKDEQTSLLYAKI